MKMKKTIAIVGIAMLLAGLVLAGCDDDTSNNNNNTETKHALAGKLLILQAYGTGKNTDGAVSHSFIELYNTTNAAIDLTGFSVQYANGTKAADEATKDCDWQKIDLSGSIPAGASFLIILGEKRAPGARLQLVGGDKTELEVADIYVPYNQTLENAEYIDEHVILSNRAWKVVLLGNQTLLTDAVQNPFNIGNGKTVADYIDMVGGLNEDGDSAPSDADQILGFETRVQGTTVASGTTGYLYSGARLSKQQSLRRISLTDTDINGDDFRGTRYQNIPEAEMEAKRPRSTADGNWDPMATWTLPVDYSKLKLNEVSGVGQDADKFYELYNTGSEAINLKDVTIYYNAAGNTGDPLPTGEGNLTWTGLETHTIAANGFLSLIGRDNPTGTNPGSFTTGLTAGRKLIITLKDPAGNVIDECIRTKDTDDYAITDKSFSRIPDGTGPFYFTDPTPNATNGTTTTDLIKLPMPDYTKLKLNEVSGVGNDTDKFYELYNTGDESIDLVGVKIYYNANSNNGEPLPTGMGNLTWTGTSTHVIEANGFLSLIGRNTAGSFTTGLTAARNLIITLEDPYGNTIDQCIRAKDTDDYAITDKSYSRIPDGTGSFYFTTPTPDATNGTETTGLTLVPQQ